MDHEKLLTVDEIASTLRVPKSWIYARTRLSDQPDSIPHLVIGKYRRFRLSEVMAWIQKNGGRITS